MKKIYISYAGDGDKEKRTSESLLNKFKQKLTSFNLIEYRAKSSSGDEYNIEELIEDIGTAECIIVIVSEKYLTQSEYCQKEIKRFIENAHIAQRVFPILVEDLDDIFEEDIKNNLIKKAHKFIDQHVGKIEDEREKIAFTVCKNTTVDFIKKLKESVNWSFRYNEVNQLVEKIETLYLSPLKDFMLTNKPKYIEKQYQRDIFRQCDYAILNASLTPKENLNVLFRVYGPPGVGKSSFMAKTFNELSNYNFEKIIYFIEGHEDYLQHLEELFLLIKDSFSKLLQINNISFNLSNIKDEGQTSSKIEKLFNIYSKYIYPKNNKAFVLMVDALDTLNDENKFMFDVIKNYEGIHFILSGRKQIEEKIKINLLNMNKGLYIYQNNSNNGMLLENLSSADTYLYFDDNQKLEGKLTVDELNNIKEKIYQKSDGLPKYFELMVNKLNKFAVESQQSINLYEKLNEYISKIPKDLEALYLEEFKNLSRESFISLEILTILYWSNTGLTKETIFTLLEDSEISNFDNALNELSYLIEKNGDKYEINHLSIKEALFTYYKLNQYNKKTAIQLEQSFIKKAFDLETPILKYLANNEVEMYDLFSSIYYYDEKNKLFQKLKYIIEYVMQNKEFQKDKEILKLYYQFSKILYAQDMINPDILSDNTVKVTDLFTGELQKYTKSFNIKILALYSNYKFINIYDLNKILAIAIMTENYYFISKYFKEYMMFRYTKKYFSIFSEDILSIKQYNELDSMISKMYVSMRWHLMNKEVDERLSLYEDDGLMLYFDNTFSPDKNHGVVQVIKDVVQSKKQRGFAEKQMRYYQTIRHSKNIKLKKYFYHSIYSYAKKTDKLNDAVQSGLSQVATDMIMENIENFDRSDPLFKYLPTEYKQKINQLNQLKQSYENNTLKAEILTTSPEVIYFINEEDIIDFLSFNEDKEDYKLSYPIGKIIRKFNSDTVLNKCKDILLNYKDKTSTDYFNLAIIYYKQGELEQLKKLEYNFIQLDFERIELSFIQKISNTIDNGLMDIYPVLKNYRACTPQFLTNYLKKSNFSMHELETFEKVISENKPENFVIYLTNISFYINDNDLLKRLFIQYKNRIDTEQKNFIILNIIKFDSFANFINKLRNFDNNFQIKYILKLKEVYIKTRDPITDSNFWELFFNAIVKSSLNKDVATIMQKVYQRNDCIDFCKKNPHIVREAYLFIDQDKTEYALKIKALLYKLVLNVEDAREYCKLIEQEWIPENEMSHIAVALAYYMHDFNDLLRMSRVCSGLDKAKILIDIGLTCNKVEQLHEGVALLYDFKKISKENIVYFNNYIQYTLLRKLEDEGTSNFIIDTFIADSSNDTALTTFLNMEKFNNSNDFFNFYIKSPKKFLENYLNYIEYGHTIDIELFNNKKESHLDHLAMLYDQYKLAEQQEDELTYNKMENIFSEFKIIYKKWVDENFDHPETLSLDNLFPRLKEQETFSVDLIKTEYMKFYKILKSIYNVYMESNYEHNIEKIQEAVDKFNSIKDEVVNNEDYMNILKEKSNISSKLAFKIDNIDLFAPK